jgi:hypothetical protein
MKGFIERLAFLIHWIGFAVAVGGVALGLFNLIVEWEYWMTGGEGLRLYQLRRYLPLEVRLMPILAAMTGYVAFGGFSWALKWLLSGNKSILPWKSSE